MELKSRLGYNADHVLLSFGLLARTWNLPFCSLTLEKGRLFKWAVKLAGEKEARRALAGREADLLPSCVRERRKIRKESTRRRAAQHNEVNSNSSSHFITQILHDHFKN